MGEPGKARIAITINQDPRHSWEYWANMTPVQAETLIAEKMKKILFAED
jgi:hypothetical protein